MQTILRLMFPWSESGKRSRNSNDEDGDCGDDDPPVMKKYCSVSNRFPKYMPSEEEENWVTPRSKPMAKVHHIPIIIEEGHPSSSSVNTQRRHINRPSLSSFESKTSFPSTSTSRLKNLTNGHESSQCNCNTRCAIHKSPLDEYSKLSEISSFNKTYRNRQLYDSPLSNKETVNYYVNDNDENDDDVEYVGIIRPEIERVQENDDVVDLSESDNSKFMLFKRVKSSIGRILDTSKKKMENSRTSSPYFENCPKKRSYLRTYEPSSRISPLLSIKPTNTFKPLSRMTKSRVSTLDTRSLYKRNDSRAAILRSFNIDEKESFKRLIKNVATEKHNWKSNFSRQLQPSKEKNEKLNADFIDLTKNLCSEKVTNGTSKKETSKMSKVVDSATTASPQDQSDPELITSADESSTTSSTQLKYPNSLKMFIRHSKVSQPLWLVNLDKKYSEISLYREKEVIRIEETEEEVELPELTGDQEARIDAALKLNPADEVLVKKFNLSIHRRDIHSLSGLNWLNDEVINFYMNLIMERSQLNKKLPSVYSMNTFFYPRLTQIGHSGLKRWTRKVDVFSHHLMLVPVHLGVHWCMSIIHFKNKTIKYYDSMGGRNDDCCAALLKYLEDELMDKKKEKLDVSAWKLECVKDIPHQMNGSDCGMFSCMFAEFISRDAPITFSQNDMPYFRRKMVLEIVDGQLII